MLREPIQGAVVLERREVVQLREPLDGGGQQERGARALAENGPGHRLLLPDEGKGKTDRLVHQSWGTLAAVVLAAVAAWAVIGRRLEGLLLLPFATVRFDDHTKFALLLAVLTAAVMGVRGRVLRSA